MNLLTKGLSRFPLNLSCSSHRPTSPSVQISIKVLKRFVKTSEEIDCDMYLKLYGDLINVLGLQTNVTVLKVKVKVRVRKFGGQLEHS